MRRNRRQTTRRIVALIAGLSAFAVIAPIAHARKPKPPPPVANGSFQCVGSPQTGEVELTLEFPGSTATAVHKFEYHVLADGRWYPLTKGKQKNTKIKFAGETYTSAVDIGTLDGGNNSAEIFWSSKPSKAGGTIHGTFACRLEPKLAVTAEQRNHRGEGRYSTGPLTLFQNETVDYTVSVSNDGNTPLEIEGDDPLCPEPIDGVLGAGEGRTYECSHKINATERAAGNRGGSVSVRGTATEDHELHVAANSAQLNATIVTSKPGLTLTGHTTPEAAASGATVVFYLSGRNTGNVYLTPKQLSSEGCTLEPAQLNPEIAPNETFTLKCSRTLTPADEKQGEVEDHVRLTATSVDEIEVAAEATARIGVSPVTLTLLQRDDPEDEYRDAGLWFGEEREHEEPVEYSVMVTNHAAVPVKITGLNCNCSAGTLVGITGTLEAGETRTYYFSQHLPNEPTGEEQGRCYRENCNTIYDYELNTVVRANLSSPGSEHEAFAVSNAETAGYEWEEELFP